MLEQLISDLLPSPSSVQPTQTNSERVDVHGGIVYEVTGSTTGDLTINGNLMLLGPQQKLKFSLRSFKLLTEEYFSLTQTGYN